MAVIPQLMGFDGITSQVKEMLDTHENTVMKYSNTAIERLERKVDNRERSFKERNGRLETFNTILF